MTADDLLTKAIEVGADNFEETEDSFLIYTHPEKLKEIKEKVSKAGLIITSVDLSMEPQNLITLNDKDKAGKAINIIRKIEALDDVLKVHTNLDIPEEILKDLA